jgi:hypothetical protein
MQRHAIAPLLIVVFCMGCEREPSRALQPRTTGDPKRKELSPLKEHTIITRSGEAITIHVDSDGNSACPVCGGVFPGEWPWGECYECDGDGNATGEPYACASFDICPCCNTQYGYDDSPKEGQLLADRWRELRLEWLRTVEITPAIREQLRNIGEELE